MHSRWWMALALGALCPAIAWADSGRGPAPGAGQVWTVTGGRHATGHTTVQHEPERFAPWYVPAASSEVSSPPRWADYQQVVSSPDTSSAARARTSGSPSRTSAGGQPSSAGPARRAGPPGFESLGAGAADRTAAVPATRMSRFAQSVARQAGAYEITDPEGASPTATPAAWQVEASAAPTTSYPARGMYRRRRQREPVHWHPLFREHAYLDRPWHAGLFVGGFIGDTLSEAPGMTFELDEGPIGGLHLGYDIDDFLGVESSLAFASADVRGPFGDDADLILFDVSAVFYPIGVGERWIPYVTAGAGLTDFNFDVLGDTTSFTMPFGGGVKIPLSERSLLRFDFRDHLALNEGGFYESMNNFSITAGFEIRFGRPAGLE